MTVMVVWIIFVDSALLIVKNVLVLNKMNVLNAWMDFIVSIVNAMLNVQDHFLELDLNMFVNVFIKIV